MVGMSLPVDGSCDHELKVKGISDIEIGDRTQDSGSEAAPSQTSSGNSAANSASTASRSQGPSLYSYGIMVILEMHYSCYKVRKTVRHWNSHCVGRISSCHGFVY